MTNQERALAIAGCLEEVEKTLEKLKLTPTDAVRMSNHSNAVAALHQSLFDHASAMATELGLDVGALSLGGSK